ncbi:MAG: AIR synthase related protein, partial [Polyangiaceae bacterium]
MTAPSSRPALRRWCGPWTPRWRACISRAWLGPIDIGWRATAAAISDLAAMGAEPLGVLAALVLPDDVDDAALAAIADGQRGAAEDAGTAVIGGNLARGRELTITTTALGRAIDPLPRDGARAGDAVWLAG